MTLLPTLGWRAELAAQLPAGTAPGRVARVDRSLLAVLTADGERRVHPGSGLYADAALGGPAVGDWVALRDDLAVAVLPRRSAFTRTVAGRTSAAQVVAANLDLVLVVDALAGPSRLRRVERYLAVAWSSGATPVVVLTKADLSDDVAAAVAEVSEDALGVDVLAVSALTGEGLDALGALLGPGVTAAMAGPSGVGKSSLANALAGRELAATREIRDDGRGRHTTTARELHLLPGGGLLVDTPGMRELGLYDDADGVAAAYADVAELAAECRFRDCAHRTEPGCAVAAAIADGRLDPARFAGWRKLRAEAHRQLLRVDARARAEERARVRALHRSMRDQPIRSR
ncbi:ribosome small subunit-dependent GTPase A [Blastococcus sp. TML/M2B]|uniref:ribosome small subunit-dependent GTPase A n=1 Tax=unclassified Blastococcus TaxID=2619396 RepID=UPI00190ADAE0|nr:MULTISPECIES: ribosome small subunit-dependent GTPase A [unclassified Blastococcus]MBN1094194.1 ribosome small subunit-dependent GTPase A [Blastococcus sp. TML/M2B]MBN1095691.1 ribosome small subunit-dependent GTPase A [Blastococcus sp. TML/C7B]